MVTTVRDTVDADREAIAGMLTRAFQDDPGGMWIFPDPTERAVRELAINYWLFDECAKGFRLTTGECEAASI